jgi:hypothetical protein
MFSRTRNRVAVASALAAIVVTALTLGALPQLASAGQLSPAVAAVLTQQTNLAPSKVTTAPVCGTTQPGMAECDSTALELRSDGSLVHPDDAPQGPAETGAASADAEPAGLPEPNSGTPAWLQQAYDTTWLSANRGAGDTVAIVDAYDDPTADADLATYRSSYSLPSCTQAAGCLTILNQNGQTHTQASSWPATNASWESEESLDLDAVSALCPNCHIVLVEANSNSLANFAAAESAAAAYPGVDQISNSWGSASSSPPPAGQFTFSGISVLASSGDDGYEGTTAQYPAAFAGVTAVGGTTLITGSTVSARGFSETAWTGGGSSCATLVSQPAWQVGQSCTGRATTDIAADGDPATGLLTYGTAQGGWGLFGGTSLSTPLTAAFEAVTQVSGASSPQWTYTDAADLNDITSGTNAGNADDGSATCTTALSYLCNAGIGFDGPTGNGSIDGDVTLGGPGIGGPDACTGSVCWQPGAGYATSTTSGSAQLQAQIDPNGLVTTYYWEYGTTPSLGQQTVATTLPASVAPVTVVTTMGGLAASETYDYRLVAANADGTAYGYMFSVTTPAAPAQTSSLGDPSTTASGGAAATTTSSAPASPSATATTPTEGGSSGQSTASTPPITPGSSVSGTETVPPATTASASQITLRLSGRRPHARVGDVLTAALAAGAQPTDAVITQLVRCRTSCRAVSTAVRYTLTDADAGALIRVQLTQTSGGDFSDAFVGPVLSPRTAGATLDAGRSATLRTSRGTTLASVRTVSARKRSRGTAVTVKRSPHTIGALRAWICPTALDVGGRPRPCSAPVKLGQAASTLHVPVAGSFAVVVQR